ncbi:MAG: hypothetical protein V6Z89_07190 [Desulfobacter sp.]
MATEQELKRIHNLVLKAYSAGLYIKAARLSHKGAEQAEAAGKIKEKVSFLFWEGESLGNVDKEQAMIPLLQAATYQPEANPADTYNAMTSLIEISISTRPAASTRNLISQGRDHLRRMGKEVWRHKLDHLEGNLETACFNFQQAQVCYATAWEYYSTNSNYPSYTEASHLSRLCENSFYLQDKTACADWLAELKQCNKKLEGDKQRLNQVLILQQRLLGEAGEKTVYLAQEVLKKSDSIERIDTNVPALRALILCGYWPLVEERIAATKWDKNDFNDMLFRADKHLLRALATLNLPMQDLELNPIIEIRSLAQPNCSHCTKAEAYLAKAVEFYRKTGSIAEKEDMRLMVSAYAETVQTRLEQVKRLQRYISEAKT